VGSRGEVYPAGAGADGPTCHRPNSLPCGSGQVTNQPLFPLLLVLVTILGLIASGDPSLRHEALTAVAKQVPLIGHQLAGNVHQLRCSSVIGLVPACSP